MPLGGESDDHQIDDAGPADLDAIAAIEQQGSPHPWARETFAGELGKPQARLEVVRRRDGQVVAFCDTWWVTDEVSLLNLGTAPEARRQGHARRLLWGVGARARAAGLRLLTLEVRRSNEAAIALYRGLGFVVVGVRPAYYADNLEDALVMNLELQA